MLRTRYLECKENVLSLTTVFCPSSNSSDDDFLSDYKICGVHIVFNLEDSTPISCKQAESTLAPYPLLDFPPLFLVSEELNYMFNLSKSLLPYETSQTSESQD